MFKKLKDKIAEEVKSSPQRIQQFAQAAQAAVTSASSSISDISNNDLFSIADDDTPQNSPMRSAGGPAPVGFQDVSLSHAPSPLRPGPMEGSVRAPSPVAELPAVYPPPPGSARSRKLSNSSVASDVSFRLPSYETPGSMYHLQSDLDVSASEIEDNIPVGMQLERVSKEQLYSAYRRTCDKYNKYRGRYTDLARHYRGLERENAKARAVLVETQDKALRRISELREQCTLEQSAKAHLENALRLDLDDRNNKIESLNTKIKLLQSYNTGQSVADTLAHNSNTAGSQSKEVEVKSTNGEQTENHQPLIDLSSVTGSEVSAPEPPELQELEARHAAKLKGLNNKIHQLEQLVAKCKDTIKDHRAKNDLLTEENMIVSARLDQTNEEKEQLTKRVANLEKDSSELVQSKSLIAELKEQINGFGQKQIDDLAQINRDLETAREEISKLNKTVDVLSKREEENVISLAENKLSVHKELDTKESEIKVLKDSIKSANLEIKSNELVVGELKSKLHDLEAEKAALKEQLSGYDTAKDEIGNLEGKLKEARVVSQELEAKCSSYLENVKCTELQVKQEVDEKMAVMDRNNFLEGRNKHLADEKAKKNKQIADLEKELMDSTKDVENNKRLSVLYEALVEEEKALKIEYQTIQQTKDSLESEVNASRDIVSSLQENVEFLTTQVTALKSDLESSREEVSKMAAELTEKQDGESNNFEREYESLKIEYEKAGERIDEITGNMFDAAKKFEAEKIEVIDKIQEEMKRALDEAAAKAKCDYDVKAQECLELTVTYNKLQEELKNYEMKASEFKSVELELDNVKCECKRLSEEKRELEVKLESSIDASRNEHSLDELQQIKSDYQALSDEKAKLESLIRNTVTELEILKSECEQLRSEKEAIERKMANVEAENNDVKATVTTMVESISQLQGELSKVQESHSQIVAEKNNIEEKISLAELAESDKQNENGQLTDKLLALEQEKDRLIKDKESLVSDNDRLLGEKNRLVDENSNLIGQRDGLVIEKDELAQRLSDVRRELEAGEVKLKEYSDNNAVWQEKLSNILDANNTLHEKCGRLKLEKEGVNERIAVLEQRQSEHDGMRKLFEEAKLEKEFLNMRVNQLESDLKQVNADRNKLDSEKDQLQKELAQMVNERRDKIQGLGEDLAKLKAELETVRAEKSRLQKELEHESSQKSLLSSKLETIEDTSRNTELLSEEKGALEARLTELQEKYKIIKTSNENEVENLNEAYRSLQIEKEKLELKCRDVDELSAKYENFKSENERMAVQIRVLEKVEEEHNVMLEELLTLKGEKSKLASDIEGLQTHLTKVSKDNGQLNDRLREMIANGEVLQATHDQGLGSSPSENVESKLNKLTEANNQLLEELRGTEELNGRILDLERQNSILFEEKLELQDQIKSSMDRHDMMGTASETEKDYEINNLRAKTKEMLGDRADLEARLADLELISRSGDSNLKVLEQRNEKLKLTNEKLERRLDEALVSLNHIRTMEENTELEYLRNILYEYLTGPSYNNMVLAKVLSAVVKFDKRQTQLVLEREKERQGVLAQLGLL